MAVWEAEWRRRRVELGRVLDTADDAIVQAWVAAWDDIADDLERLLTRIATDGGSVSRVVALRWQRQAVRMVTDQIEALAADGTVTLTDAARQVIRQAVDGTHALIGTQLPGGAGLTATLMQPPTGAMAAIVKRTTESIVSRNRPLTGEAERAMRSTLRRALAEGLNGEEAGSLMLARCRDIFDGGLARAVTIGRTELMDAHRAAAQAVELANRDMLVGWRWQADLSARSCLACVSMSGSVHPIQDPGPLGHPRCRCTRTPITKSWADLGFPGAREPGSQPPTGPDWFAHQPATTQQQILGEARYRLYQQGMPLEDMTHLVPNTGWRPSVQVKPLRDL